MLRLFDFALAKAKASAEESIMIGDSLEIDIAGAINAGMDQVHVNYNNLPQNITPTYTIKALKELEEFL